MEKSKIRTPKQKRKIIPLKKYTPELIKRPTAEGKIQKRKNVFEVSNHDVNDVLTETQQNKKKKMIGGCTGRFSASKKRSLEPNKKIKNSKQATNNSTLVRVDSTTESSEDELPFPWENKLYNESDSPKENDVTDSTKENIAEGQSVNREEPEVINDEENDTFLKNTSAKIQFKDPDIQLHSVTLQEGMVALGETGYYCLRNTFDYAISNTEKKESILARRLVDGVIKPEAVISCTLSGRPPRAHGRERQKQEVSMLHVQAIKAIKDFSRAWAIKYQGDGWTTQSTEQVTHSIRTRLNEIKKTFSKN